MVVMSAVVKVTLTVVMLADMVMMLASRTSVFTTVMKASTSVTNSEEVTVVLPEVAVPAIARVIISVTLVMIVVC